MVTAIRDTAGNAGHKQKDHEASILGYELAILTIPNQVLNVATSVQ